MKPRPDQEAEIIRLFYRTELRPGEEIINNMDSTIAKEVGVNIGVVHRILEREMIAKVKMAGKDLLSTDEKEMIKEDSKDYEDIEVQYVDVKPPNTKPFANKDINKKTSKHSSKYTGVSWHIRYKKWTSSIRIKGVLKPLGYFTDELEASEAYQEALTKSKEPIYFSP